jgi:hypothetical protein
MGLGGVKPFAASFSARRIQRTSSSFALAIVTAPPKALSRLLSCILPHLTARGGEHPLYFTDIKPRKHHQEGGQQGAHNPIEAHKEDAHFDLPADHRSEDGGVHRAKEGTCGSKDDHSDHRQEDNGRDPP